MPLTSESPSTLEARAEQKLLNRLMMKLSGLLGLTTGIGIVAWGAWSLLMTVAINIYERSGLTETEVLIEDALNQGMLQSAMLIALGVIILELRRLNQIFSFEPETDD